MQRSVRGMGREKIVQLLERLAHFPVDAETTLAYAVVRAGLRKRGTPLPENDVWIAALALQHDLSIVSRDTHFKWVEDIHCITW
jgi:tRNA(fMet)-specific endonuclease VapC